MRRIANPANTYGLAVTASKGPRRTEESKLMPLPASMVNEVLLKVLCFNLSMVVHSIYEMNIDPTFCLECPS
jgi:hypothetical protein